MYSSNVRVLVMFSCVRVLVIFSCIRVLVIFEHDLCTSDNYDLSG